MLTRAKLGVPRVLLFEINIKRQLLCSCLLQAPLFQGNCNKLCSQKRRGVFMMVCNYLFGGKIKGKNGCVGELRGETYANVKCQKRVSVAFSQDFPLFTKNGAYIQSYTEAFAFMDENVWGRLEHTACFLALPSSCDMCALVTIISHCRNCHNVLQHTYVHGAAPGPCCLGVSTCTHHVSVCFYLQGVLL